MANKSLEIIKELKEFEWQTKTGLLGYSVGISIFSLASIIALQQMNNRTALQCGYSFYNSYKNYFNAIIIKKIII